VENFYRLVDWSTKLLQLGTSAWIISFTGTRKPAQFRIAVHQGISEGDTLESNASPKLWAESPGRFAGNRHPGPGNLFAATHPSNVLRSRVCSANERNPLFTDTGTPKCRAHDRTSSARSRTTGSRPRSAILTARLETPSTPTTRSLPNSAWPR